LARNAISGEAQEASTGSKVQHFAQRAATCARAADDSTWARKLCAYFVQLFYLASLLAFERSSVVSLMKDTQTSGASQAALFRVVFHIIGEHIPALLPANIRLKPWSRTSQGITTDGQFLTGLCAGIS
jgi:hypothetical protein